MAFKPAAVPTSATPANDSWKAQAFINIYLPKASGDGMDKLGAIPLKVSKRYEAAIIERLSTGGEEAMKAFVNCLEFDFRLVETDKEIKLPF